MVCPQVGFNVGLLVTAMTRLVGWPVAMLGTAEVQGDKDGRTDIVGDIDGSTDIVGDDYGCSVAAMIWLVGWPVPNEGAAGINVELVGAEHRIGA